MSNWVVKLDGFDPEPVEAETASQARYKVYKLARDAGYFREGFRAFLERVGSTWRKPQ
jgi:hypothetical protein